MNDRCELAVGGQRDAREEYETDGADHGEFSLAWGQATRDKGDCLLGQTYHEYRASNSDDSYKRGQTRHTPLKRGNQHIES